MHIDKIVYEMGTVMEMEMEKYIIEQWIQQFFAIQLVLIGLSHLLYAKEWSKFFALIQKSGVPSIIIVMYTLPSGIIIVIGHQVWSGIPLILTLIGWGYLLKCVLYLLISKLADKPVDNMAKGQRGLQTVGIVMAVLGGVVAVPAFFS